MKRKARIRLTQLQKKQDAKYLKIMYSNTRGIKSKVKSLKEILFEIDEIHLKKQRKSFNNWIHLDWRKQEYKGYWGIGFLIKN